MHTCSDYNILKLYNAMKIRILITHPHLFSALSTEMYIIIYLAICVHSLPFDKELKVLLIQKGKSEKCIRGYKCYIFNNKTLSLNFTGDKLNGIFLLKKEYPSFFYKLKLFGMYCIIILNISAIFNISVNL